MPLDFHSSLDFSGQNLRGRNFKKQNLTDANFSNADIRGTNFTHSILTRANFNRAEAGLQKRWKAVIFSLTILLLIVSMFLSWGTVFSAQYFLFNPDSPNAKSISLQLSFILFLFSFVFLYFLAVFRGLEVGLGVSVLAWSMGLALTGSGIMAGAFVGVLGVSLSIALSGVLAGVIGIILVEVLAFSMGGVFIVLSGIGSFQISSILTLILMSSYMGWQTFQENKKFALLHKIAIAIVTKWGTSFQGADLTDADFTQAMLKSTDLRNAVLKRVCWYQGRGINLARVGKTYLKDKSIQDLLTTGQAKGANFDRQDLRGINLQRANLEHASFTDADLSQASLWGASLFEAKLVRTNLDQTDLSGACLTGTYIEDWGITRKTRLDGVECKYVYMNFPKEGDRDPNRMPPLEQGEFSENDFNIFVTSVLDTLDLYHKQNINAGVAVTVLRGLTKDYPTQFEIVGLEKRGKDQFLIRLKVFGQTSHFQLQREYYARYEQALPLYDPKKLLPDTDVVITQMIEAVKKNPGTHIENLHNQGVVITGGVVSMVNQNSEQGNNTYIEGSVTGSTINLGEISGSVSNAVNQLPNSPALNQPGIKELLIQLQKVIEEEPELSPEDRADLLEQVKVLAEAKQTSTPEEKNGLVRKAKKIFDATLKTLPDTAKVVDVCSKLLPMILKALGFSV